MTKLFRTEKSTYTDQYGFEHDCYEILEEVEVQPTGEYYTYDYYSEVVKNPKYRDSEGREWICMVPTDYGGSSSWSRRDENGKPIRDELWVREYRVNGGPPRVYGLHPLIRKETK